MTMHGSMNIEFIIKVYNFIKDLVKHIFEHKRQVK